MVFKKINMQQPKFCATCGSLLEEKMRDGYKRFVCTSDSCDYVFWNNPTPVVAAIVEHDDDNLVFVQSIGWPKHWYALVTGFLEFGELPEEGVKREVKEEVGLEVEEVNFVGMYTFKRMNQLIIAYHVKATGTINLDTTELADYKIVPIEKARPWPAGTGKALKEWLLTRGYDREYVQF